MASHLGMSGSDATLYDARGRPIHDSMEVFDGGTYVLGQHEPFDGQWVIEEGGKMVHDLMFRIIEAANGNIVSARESQYQNYSSNYRNQGSNYAPIAKKRVTKKKSDPHESHYSRPQSSFTYGDRTEIYSIDQGDYEMPNIACKFWKHSMSETLSFMARQKFAQISAPRMSDLGNYNIYREPDDDFQRPEPTYEYEETPWGNLDDLREKDKQMLAKHKQ